MAKANIDKFIKHKKLVSDSIKNEQFSEIDSEITHSRTRAQKRAQK